MPRPRGGDKRSSWLTFQRRLFLVRQLIRGPARGADLIATASAALGDETYPPDALAALRHDLAALRREFECAIYYEPSRGYVMNDLGRLALLDLPDTDLESLAYLLSTFADDVLPNAGQISALLGRVVALLPEERRRGLAIGRPHPRIDRPMTASPGRAALALLKRAVGRQQVSFEYRSSYVAGSALRHIVAPYDLIYRDGHVYLDAYCYSCAGESIQHYSLYRTDRIVPDTLKALPDRLPPGPLPRRTYQVRYLLSPQVARQRDIALWFTESQVEFTDDGAADVQGRTSDLWQARQILLRYREHCCVLEPSELVEMMRETLERMQMVYATATDHDDLNMETRDV